MLTASLSFALISLGLLALVKAIQIIRTGF